MHAAKCYTIDTAGTSASRALHAAHHNNTLTIHHNKNHNLPDNSSFFSNSLSRDKETDEKDCMCKALGENQKVTQAKHARRRQRPPSATSVVQCL